MDIAAHRFKVQYLHLGRRPAVRVMGVFQLYVTLQSIGVAFFGAGKGRTIVPAVRPSPQTGEYPA